MEVVQYIKKKDIPKSSRELDKKYKAILKALASMPADEAMVISMDKKKDTFLRKVVKDGFTHSKYTVSRRGEHLYIWRD
jgi:mannose/cellobiose epimerase-like protein (N-acyl-D-glucosamine 2-epimerase family)